MPRDTIPNSKHREIQVKAASFILCASIALSASAATPLGSKEASEVAQSAIAAYKRGGALVLLAREMTCWNALQPVGAVSSDVVRCLLLNQTGMLIERFAAERGSGEPAATYSFKYAVDRVENNLSRLGLNELQKDDVAGQAKTLRQSLIAELVLADLW